MIKTFTCLYTSQKTKKRKTWNDGILKIRVFDSSSEPAATGVKRPLIGAGRGGGGGRGGVVQSGVGAGGGSGSFGGMGFLLASGGSTLALEQALGSRPLSPDEVASLLRREFGELEFDNYIISIEGEAEPAQAQNRTQGQGQVQGRAAAATVTAVTEVSVSRPAVPSVSGSGLLKLPKFKIPSTVKAPARPAVQEDAMRHGGSGMSGGAAAATGLSSSVGDPTGPAEKRHRSGYGGYSRDEDLDDIDDIWGGNGANAAADKEENEDQEFIEGFDGRGDIYSRIDGTTHEQSFETSYQPRGQMTEKKRNDEREMSAYIPPKHNLEPRNEDRVLSPLWGPPQDGRPSYDPELVWGFESQESEGAREREQEVGGKGADYVVHESSQEADGDERDGEIFAAASQPWPRYVPSDVSGEKRAGKEEDGVREEDADIWDF